MRLPVQSPAHSSASTSTMPPAPWSMTTPIVGTRGSGIQLDRGGAVTNAVSAYIGAVNGVYIASGDGSVANAGAIVATATGVLFGREGIDILINTGTIAGRHEEGVAMDGIEEAVTNAA